MAHDTLQWRSLDRNPVQSLADYLTTGGGTALAAARKIEPAALIDTVSDAGLRGRGGAGFPTGLKLRTVAAAHSPENPTSVVVNAAEGEPGTFKDRALLRTNPYRVIEGALVAATAVGAPEIRVGIKASFHREIQRLRSAITEATEAGWFNDIAINLVLGPSSYLFGEETAMLEVMEQRQPFPRVTPPFRRGLEDHDTRSAAGVHLATVGGSDEPPALVDNVETLANVALIIANGPDWFRQLGTERSPGTIVCTVTGATRRHGVGEVAMGTTLREVIESVGWGARPGYEITAVLSGTANAIIPAHLLDTPLTHEDMSGAGSGLGSAGFIVFDNQTDIVAIAQGVSRFLAVESCGQCEPCKTDGIALSELLGDLARSKATDRQMTDLRRRVDTVAIGARCNLARQQAEVVGSLLGLFDDAVSAHLGSTPPGATTRFTPVPIVPIADIVGGRAILETDQLRKQPDWTYDATYSGTPPAAWLGDTPVHITETTAPTRLEEWTTGITDDHPLAIIDEAHDLLDGVLREAFEQAHNGGNHNAASKLAHLMRTHIDVTRRILYPMARRYGDDAGEEVADLAEQQESTILKLVAGLADADGAALEETLTQLSTQLRLHAENEDQLIAILRDSMNEGQRDELADALAEARMTSTVP